MDWSILTYKLRFQQEEVLALIQSIPAAFMDEILVPGKWSIHDHFAHLSCYQRVFEGRIERICKEDTALLARYRAEDDSAFPIWQKKSTQDLIIQYRLDRERISRDILKLPRLVLEKTGHHPVFGPMDIRQWTQFFLLHENHHLYAMFRMKNRLG